MIQRMRAKQQENVARSKLSPEDLENCKRYNLTGNQLRAIRRTGLSLPHEARKRHQEKSVLESMEQEDDLFGLGDDASLDDLFSALRTDDKFMNTSIADVSVKPPEPAPSTHSEAVPPSSEPSVMERIQERRDPDLFHYDEI